jgi:hypothetical protein
MAQDESLLVAAFYRFAPLRKKQEEKRKRRDGKK